MALGLPLSPWPCATCCLLPALQIAEYNNLRTAAADKASGKAPRMVGRRAHAVSWQAAAAQHPPMVLASVFTALTSQPLTQAPFLPPRCGAPGPGARCARRGALHALCARREAGGPRQALGCVAMLSRGFAGKRRRQGQGGQACSRNCNLLLAARCMVSKAHHRLLSAQFFAARACCRAGNHHLAAPAQRQIQGGRVGVSACPSLLHSAVLPALLSAGLRLPATPPAAWPSCRLLSLSSAHVVANPSHAAAASSRTRSTT